MDAGEGVNKKGQRVTQGQEEGMAIRRVPVRAPPAQALASVGACFGGGASAPCGAGSRSCPSTPAARAVRWGLAESGGRPLQYSSLLANPPQAAVWGEQVWGVSKGTRLGCRRKPQLGCRGGRRDGQPPNTAQPVQASLTPMAFQPQCPKQASTLK